MMHSTRLPRTLCVFALACLSGSAVHAQESIRPSGVSSLAADARQEMATRTSSEFMRLGPVNVGASAEVGIEVNDNVGLSELNRKSDVIFRPRLAIDAEWRVSRLNTIRLGLGISYAKYASNSKLDTQALLLDPGTQLGFDIYVGEHLRLNIHDRIQITQNPIEETTLSNVQRFARLQNSAGVTAFIRYPDLDFVLGYDHFNFNTLSSEFNYMDRTEEQFFASARRRVNDALGVGVEGSAGLINYEQNVNNNGTSWTVGAFADTTLSQYTKVRVSGGWQEMGFDGNGTNRDASNFGSWYANIALAQRLTQYLSHTLSAGREARLGLSVNFADYVFARYAASWRMNDTWTWGLDGFVEDAKESGGAALSAEHAFRWGGGASLRVAISSRTALTFRYTYVDKDSDLALRSYQQNSGTISLNHQF
jgi:Outer membrane protein beta-barrel domain